MKMLDWTRLATVAAVSCLILSACQSTAPAAGSASAQGEPSQPGYAISLLPVGASTLPYGDTVGFRMTSGVGGYAHLYALDPSGKVQMWAENLPLQPGKSSDYPLAADQLTIRAGPPAGDERVILFVTAQPFSGFAAGGTEAFTRPADLPYQQDAFLRQLESVARSQPTGTWAKTEVMLRIFDPMQPAS